jgi:hypothetical protein
MNSELLFNQFVSIQIGFLMPAIPLILSYLYDPWEGNYL